MSMKNSLFHPRLIIAMMACQLGLLSNVCAQESCTELEVAWEIVLNKPDAITRSPCFSLIMSSRPELTGEYAEIRLNAPVENENPEISVTIWSTSGGMIATSSRKVPPLSVENDVVQITTKIKVADSGTWYEIASVSSGSWGTIDDQDMPKAMANDSTSVDYNIDLTKNESEIETGKNRVESVAITRVAAKRNNNWEIDNSLHVIFGDVKYPIQTKLSDEVVDEKTAYE